MAEENTPLMAYYFPEEVDLKEMETELVEFYGKGQLERYGVQLPLTISERAEDIRNSLKAITLYSEILHRKKEKEQERAIRNFEPLH